MVVVLLLFLILILLASTASLSFKPVQSEMSFSHLLFCLPLLLLPCTVACRIVSVSSVGRVICPFHFSFRSSVVRRSSFFPTACIFLLFSSFVMWSLHEMLNSLQKQLISTAYFFLFRSAVRVQVTQAYRYTWIAKVHICLICDLNVNIPIFPGNLLVSAVLYCWGHSGQDFWFWSFCDNCSKILEPADY